MTDFVSKRLAKSERALTSARREVASGDLDFAAERAYYAMFYAAERFRGDVARAQPPASASSPT